MLKNHKVITLPESDVVTYKPLLLDLVPEPNSLFPKVIATIGTQRPSRVKAFNKNFHPNYYRGEFFTLL